MNVTVLAEKTAARRAEYRGAETVTAYSDPRAEFSALLCGSGIYDLGWRAKISITGKDRVRWLNGMISNNVRDLANGHGVYSFLLNPQGHILADLYAYNSGESILLDTDQSQSAKLVELLKRYIIMDKVELANISDQLTAIGIAGPHSADTLRGSGFEVPELQSLQFTNMTWRDLPLTIVRREPFTVNQAQHDSFELWLAPEDVNFIWQALLDSGATPVGSEAVELYRVALGIPRYGQDIRERDLPQETEQAHALHYQKGCYIGQEIVERIRARGAVHRKFTGFLIDGPLPAPGSKVQLEGKDLGDITTAASLPMANGDRAVALGYIRREVAGPSHVFQVGDARATVSDLPFQILI